MARDRVGASGSDVRGESWDGRDLSGQTYTGIVFADVDMTEVSDTGAVFTECTFREVQLNASSHVNAAFVNCTFTGCSFFDARLTGCKLVGSMFQRCALTMLEVSGGDWSLVEPARALTCAARGSPVSRMREADLTGVRAGGRDPAATSTCPASWLKQGQPVRGATCAARTSRTFIR